MKTHAIVVAAVILGAAIPMHAQYAPVKVVETQGQRGVATTDQKRLQFGRIEARVVKGAPYSAEVVSESIQVLQDGNRIVHRTSGRVYRDSEGRVRREEDQPSGPPAITITDPVTGKTYTLNAATRKARETRTLGGVDLSDYLIHLPGGRLGDAAGHNFVYRYALSGVVRREGEDTVTEEKLTDRTIEGVLATGLRRTTTIAAGAIGNEKPIRIVSEEWQSPDLQVLVLTDLNDPRSGRSTYRLQKINRAEPDPSLFRVPGDYSVERGGR